MKLGVLRKILGVIADIFIFMRERKWIKKGQTFEPPKPKRPKGRER